MAGKKAVLKAPKPKKQKFTGRAVSVAQIKLGGEPTLGMFPGKMQVIRAFNWYAQCVEPEQRADFLFNYMLQNGYSKEQTAIAEKKGKKFPETWAYVARMLSNGTIFDDDIPERLAQEIKTFLFRHGANAVELDDEGLPVEKPKPVVKVDKTQAQVAPMVHFIDDVIDKIIANDDQNVNFYEALTRMGCASPHAKLLQSHYDRTITEFLVVYTERDEQFNEAYRHLKKNTKQRLGMFAMNLKKDLAALVAAKKEVVRKPRKKKEVPAAKQVQWMRFQKESTEYKVASVDPLKIPGAKALITFNTKTRILSIFEANDDKGIQVKGINLLNTGVRCKKLRDPDAVLPIMTATTKAGCLQNFKTLTTKEFDMTPRTNNETILLRVFQ
jgi:hypothetical protein